MRILIKFCRNFFLWMIDFLQGSISPIQCQGVWHKRHHSVLQTKLCSTKLLDTTKIQAEFLLPMLYSVHQKWLALTLSLEASKVFIKCWWNWHAMTSIVDDDDVCTTFFRHILLCTFIHFLSLPRMQMEQIEVIIVKISPSIICSLFSFTA